MRQSILTILMAIFMLSCHTKLTTTPQNALIPTVITEKTPNDTDDPSIWVNKNNPSESLIIGTDKEAKVGGLYAFDMQGNIVHKFYPMDRPNNVDLSYDFNYQGQKIDIAVVTERKQNRIRVFSLPDLKPIDNGGILVFENEEQNEPMGIALYTQPITAKTYAIVGRKSGPSGQYLYQYELIDKNGIIEAKLIRQFGNYSGKKEIEAIAVDNALGYVYYSDETAGIRKYFADPDKGNQELAFFGQRDFKRDQEGIAIYNTDENSGYILVSDQQANHFVVYKREGEAQDKHKHQMIAKIPFSTIECDGADAINFNFGLPFSNGILVAMSNGKVFHYYDWNIIQEEIDRQQKS